MARYIDADALIEHLEDNLRECGNPDMTTKPITYGCIIGLKNVLNYAETLPTAEVVEVRHGKWIPIITQDNYLDPPYCDTLKCSECEQEVDVSFGNAKYCFNCGARMDGDEDDL